ncbi:DNA polymerase III subunit gamma/tau [Colwellia sp. 4_MG-2023]|uniref:DNA polymerase III subunit gamma/tau n=1 Tax=unclassified Colwellia TaxID=196834 RepID=UPI0026E2F374|nr:MULTISPECIES: DNA polymerase III subunit gamma/tau [unclassified Colwellia]MDO6508192.1 DNA polymerase III subunit gamma/tau [Colwellia sp. 5_MG-2023]MDO6555724.1 DNA polymerase III subunit gamma/tau [Colwellia sp. 4_MG-2023]
MSYQVLARKWRPKCFEELVGQEHVVTVLVNALLQQRLHHAYLFTGTRGVGKTTIARIFAKSLNCETGITATPCGKCDTCLEIDQGRFVDLLEIDAASKTKVDDTREILDNVQYAPTRGRYKVYLIDEVHMLSRNSFNALLKTLEEPPEHVKFILATTDPQKLPVTVLSRCLQFHLKALTVKQIEGKLTEILGYENVTHASGTLTLLAKAARGSMRDSLSLTDQAIAQGQGNITLPNIQEMLGGLDQNWVYKIVIALLKQDGVSLMALSQEIASYAPSYSRLYAELIQLFHQIAILQIVDQHFDLPAEHAQLLKKFSQAMSAEDVQLFYQICVNGRKDLPYASDEQAAFDMTLLRLFAFKPMQKSSLQPIEASSLNQTAPLSDIKYLDDVLTETPSNDEQALAQQMHEIEQQAVDIQQAGTVPFSQQANEVITEPMQAEVPPVAVANVVENNSYVPQDDMSQGLATQNFVPQSIEEGIVPTPESHIPVQVHEQENQYQEPVVQAQTLNEQPMHVDPVNTATAPKKTADTPVFDSPVSSVLATRNMLRSRKKQLDKQGKKSDGAIARQVDTDNNTDLDSADSTNTAIKTDIEKVALPKPAQPYQAESIDPSTIRKANQVDQWAHMIDSMELTARLRQLAIHATIDENSTDNNLILCLNQATKHLYTDIAQQQLQQSISQFLSRDIQVTINIVEQTVADPYQIQSHINDKRYDYAKDLLKKDEVVQGLVQHFQATLDEGSITPI